MVANLSYPLVAIAEGRAAIKACLSCGIETYRRASHSPQAATLSLSVLLRLPALPLDRCPGKSLRLAFQTVGQSRRVPGHLPQYQRTYRLRPQSSALLDATVAISSKYSKN